MKNFKLRAIVSAVALASAAFAGSSIAAQKTDNLAVSASVVDSCLLTGGTLAFGNVDVLGSAKAGTADLGAQCTNTTAYTVGLGAGQATGATTAARKMQNGTATLAYGLFTENTHTTNWGETAGTDTVSGTGTGSNQTITVYGLVPTGQQTVVTGSYSDVVVVTLNF